MCRAGRWSGIWSFSKPCKPSTQRRKDAKESQTKNSQGVRLMTVASPLAEPGTSRRPLFFFAPSRLCVEDSSVEVEYVRNRRTAGEETGTERAARRDDGADDGG